MSKFLNVLVILPYTDSYPRRPRRLWTTVHGMNNKPRSIITPAHFIHSATATAFSYRSHSVLVYSGQYFVSSINPSSGMFRALLRLLRSLTITKKAVGNLAHNLL